MGLGQYFKKPKGKIKPKKLNITIREKNLGKKEYKDIINKKKI